MLKGTIVAIIYTPFQELSKLWSTQRNEQEWLLVGLIAMAHDLVESKKCGNCTLTLLWASYSHSKRYHLPVSL